MSAEKVVAHYQQLLADTQYREALALTTLSDREDDLAKAQERLAFLEEQNNMMKDAISQAGGSVTEFDPEQGELPPA